MDLKTVTNASARRNADELLYILSASMAPHELKLRDWMQASVSVQSKR